MAQKTFADANTLITGASSGIGKELSLLFAKEGATLLLGSHPLEQDSLEKWSEELRQRYGVTVKTYPVDLAENNGPELLYLQVMKDVPHLDVLVNNAGVIAFGKLHKLSLDRMETMVRLNAVAYMKLIMLFLPGMLERKSGRILNISSVAACQPVPYQAIYGATKAFVQSMSEAVRQEIHGSRIAICTVNPTYTDTAMLRSEGFPKRLYWYRISGLWSPERVAEAAMKALKKGKARYIPGLLNFIIHEILNRILPRSLGAFISRVALRRETER